MSLQQLEDWIDHLHPPPPIDGVSTRTCDFLVCCRCGVFIAAVAEMTEGVRAVVNVNCLKDRARFTSAPTVHEFQGETIESRFSRRAANWMPAILSAPSDQRP